MEHTEEEREVDTELGYVDHRVRSEVVQAMISAMEGEIGHADDVKDLKRDGLREVSRVRERGDREEKRT